MALAIAAIGVGTILFLAFYIWSNDMKVLAVPEPIRALNIKSLAPQDVLDELQATRGGSVQEKELEAQLPPKTGRRYIVVGGGGFVGGWIAVHLLKRGENPKSIRVIDLAPNPTNIDVELASERDGLQYIVADMTSSKSINDAFSATWNDGLPSTTETTIFHTAANIRFFERHPLFLQRSIYPIVQGTENVLLASKLINADILIYTSSISVYYKHVKLLLWPWESISSAIYRKLTDDDGDRAEKHEHVSNYTIAKSMADDLVRQWDKTPLQNGKLLRTGCLRPGNVIYGPRGGPRVPSTDTYFTRKVTPIWVEPTVLSWMFGENCSLAHLCYEQRLLEFESKSYPDIGGQSFIITDPGPPLSNEDMCTTLSTITGGELKFPHLSPTLSLLMAHAMEAYYIFQYLATSTYPFLGIIFRPLPLFVSYFQPSSFSGSVHYIIDDSRARRSPQQGGLGYKGVWTTVQGHIKTWQDFEARKAGAKFAKSK